MCVIALTAYIDLGFRDFVEKLVPAPKFEKDEKCVACPKTKNYMLVGTAFDYLLRTELKRLHPDAVETELIGEKSVEMVRHAIETYGYFKATNWVLTKKEYDTMVEVAQRWKKEREEFLNTGKLTDSFLEATLSFSKLDELFRSGYYQNPTKNIYKGDVEDLRKLYELIPNYVKNHATRIYLNPDISNLFICADADLILDDRLIDIKTTKYLRLTKEYWAQIVGYQVLAENKGYKINKVGIYFSRFGKVLEIKTDKIKADDNYNKIREKLMMRWLA